MVNLLDTNISYLKGVGPKRAELLNKELGVITFNDMLNQFPFRYIDRSHIHTVSQIDNDNVYYQLIGTMSSMQSFGAPRTTRITAQFSDSTGSIEVVWFKGLKWIKTRFKAGQKYILFGKASAFKNTFNFVHPEIEEYDPKTSLGGEGLQGVYNTTEKLKDNGLGTKQIAKTDHRKEKPDKPQRCLRENTCTCKFKRHCPSNKTTKIRRALLLPTQTASQQEVARDKLHRTRFFKHRGKLQRILQQPPPLSSYQRPKTRHQGDTQGYGNRTADEQAPAR